jgi:hypothetical protein
MAPKFRHEMTAVEYEGSVRERFVSLFREPEFTVVGGSTTFWPGRLSGVKRQIDVGVVRNGAPNEWILVADAKRHGYRLDVPEVAFLGFLEDLGCRRGVLASLLGGTSGALRRAAAGDAELHVVSYDKALSFDWNRIAAGLFPWDPHFSSGALSRLASTQSRKGGRVHGSDRATALRGVGRTPSWRASQRTGGGGWCAPSDCGVPP